MVSKSVQSNEYARQLQTLAGLPKGFKYPLFNGWQAIQSQRKSGYKNTARAAREIVDNAIEAGADNVWIVFDTIREKDLRPHQRKNTVTAVAFIDDGAGMIHKNDDRSILRYALSWGGGTHFEDPDFIGKFGFGLPNSSVNQTQFTEVYTRTSEDPGWNVAALDIRREAVPESGEVRSSAVTRKPLPRFVQEYLEKKGVDLKTGTVVVWWNPDRLTVNTRASLREHLEHDFQVVYRGLGSRTKIFVDSDVPVTKVDPLFLDPDSYLFLPAEEGGARCLYDEELVVKHYLDETSGQPRLELVGPEKGPDEVTGFEYDISLADAQAHVVKPPPGQRNVRLSSMKVRVAYLPYPTFMHQEKRKVTTDAGRRFNIRKRNRGMSFVRAGREIDTVDAFPKEYRDDTGFWPLLQGYAYYWAAEVCFQPAIDDILNIGHDKQTVEPAHEFWRVLKQAKVNDALMRATKMRRDAGKEAREAKHSSPDVDLPSITAASQAATVSAPTSPGSKKMQEKQKEREEETPEPTTGTAGPEPDQPATPGPKPSTPAPRFSIEKFGSEGGVFMEPVPGKSNQVVVRLNTKHPWYDAYANAGSVQEARNATNLLLFALAAAEIRADDTEHAWLEGLRCDTLNPFLRKAVRILKSVLPASEEEDDDEPVSDDND